MHATNEGFAVARGVACGGGNVVKYSWGGGGVGYEYVDAGCFCAFYVVRVIGTECQTVSRRNCEGQNYRNVPLLHILKVRLK